MHHPLPSELYTLSLHDALPISAPGIAPKPALDPRENQPFARPRHAHIQETPRLFDLVFDVVRRGLEPRDLVILHADEDRKSTRLNSSHTVISYAVFCLKKKNQS